MEAKTIGPAVSGQGGKQAVVNLREATIERTLIYYDGPQLFSCVVPTGERFLAVLSEEDGADGSETWLYASVTEETVERVASGQIDLRDGFAGRPAYSVYVARTGSASIRELRDVPEKWLPDVGVKLK